MITPLECAKLQEYSYRVEHGLPDWTTLEEDKYDTQFFIHKYEDGCVVICFCCSNSDVDWKNNFAFFQKAYKDCEIPFYVHRGFLRCWKEVRHYIEEEVKKLEPKEICVTGWSYGGAISDLCTEDMVYLFPDLKIRNVTFGGPRVVWSFKNWKKLKSRWTSDKVESIKFKNGSDVVTAVPFLSFGFHHVSDLTHIGQPIRLWRYLNANGYHGIEFYIETLDKIYGNN